MTTSFNVNIHDLEYILKQIKIAEDHAGGKTLLQAIMDAYNATAATATQLPAGLRTVDGRGNSLVPGLEDLGAADEIFPRLLAPVFINEQDEGNFNGITNTDYSAPGDVVDSDPRTISNLLVDQTAGNPAAVMAALQYAVFSEALLPGQVAAAANAIAVAYANRLALQDAADAADAAEGVAAAALALALADAPAAVAALAAANAELAAAQAALAAATADSDAADAAAIAAQAAEDAAASDLVASTAAEILAGDAATAAQNTLGAYVVATSLADVADNHAVTAATAAAAAALALSDATLDPGDSEAVDAALAAATAASAASDAAANVLAVLTGAGIPNNVSAADIAAAQTAADNAADLAAQLTALQLAISDLVLDDPADIDAANAAATLAAANAAAALALSAQLGLSQSDATAVVAATAAALVAAGDAVAQDILDLASATSASDAADAAAVAAQAAEDAATGLVASESVEQAAAADAANAANATVAAAVAALAAATAASDAADASTLIAVLESFGIEVGPEGGLVIPNLSPDIGLSPGFNAWMTFFGQFFDHGLDLVTKGTNGTVYIPLQADDPLIAGADEVFGTADDLPAHLRFMALTRLATSVDLNGDGDTTDPGETGNTAGQNTTTPFIDQNQTYTSHASHQVFLREYVREGNLTRSTGHLLDGQAANGSLDGAIGNWAEVKAQALEMLGIKLTDADVGNVPWLRTDAYGKFIPGANGYAQVIVGLGADGKINTADDLVVEGTAAGIDLTAVGALGTGHAFLNDIAHHAGVGFVDLDHNGVMNGGDFAQVADANFDRTGDGLYTADDLDFDGDTDVDADDFIALAAAGLLADVNHDGSINLADVDRNSSGTIDLTDFDINNDGAVTAADLVADDHNGFTYDNEMLDAHFITGDGRGNENIALTTVHSIFHSEHNRMVEANKATLIENATTPEGLAFLNEWLIDDVTSVPSDLSTLTWDGERLFQAARFSTEMQYQHLVFEEFARRIQPMVDPFTFNNSPDVDPSILAEFAHTIYRFGHSMLTDTVDRLDNSLAYLNGDDSQATLIAAFLNPQMYIGSGATLEEANANIVRGLTRELGAEIDEFVVPALQSNLLGLPLDLAALNIARGREAGIPSLNETREQLYNDFGIVDLKPYANWKEFGLAIKNPMSVINFIAAYGTHDTITNATTLAEKRAAAYELVIGVDVNGGGVAADRLAFLNATGSYAGGELGGLNNVDLWIGGLAEKKNEFGGMLGSTFNFIFEYQMENLQNGDRLYYLSRTQGLNLLNNLEPNTFSDLVMRNTDLGDTYATHLSGALFITPDHIIELDRGIAQTDYDEADAGSLDPVWEDLDPVTAAIIGPMVVRDYTDSTVVDGTHDFGGFLQVKGGAHYVLGGTEGNDTLLSDSGIDAIWGDGGNDYINAGTESDDVFGGLGDDIIEDPFGDDVLRGNQGNDVITSARGADLLFGDEGNDYIVLGQDASEIFGGEGNDFILGGNGKDFLLGNEGDDWIEGGGGFDTSAGDSSDLFFNSTIIGHDVMFGQGNEHDYDAESGDDIMGSGPSVYRYEGMFGFDWAIAKNDLTGVNFDLQIPIFTAATNDVLRDRFDQVEALSGWVYDDRLDGDNRGSVAPGVDAAQSFAEHMLTQEGINRIDGLNEWFGSTGGVMDATDARQTLFGNGPVVPGGTPISSYRDGNIMMGGEGSDFLRGRGGYDLLDGDAWLNVRIKIVHNGVTYSAESMSTDTNVMGEHAGLVFNVDANGHPDFNSPAFGGRSLTALMLDGTINPGSLSIVREVLSDTTPDNDTDTAIFQGTLAEYDIEGITNTTAVGDSAITYSGFAQDLNGDGFISVRDRDTGLIGATVWQIIDGAAAQVTLNSRNSLIDDTDLIKNIEQLQFSDQIISIGGNNSLATGTVTINDATPHSGLVTPYVGQVLTATLADFADVDGIPLDPATGLPVGLTFEWQSTQNGQTGGWTTLSTGLTYTVHSTDPGHIIRAVAVFHDSQGNIERIASAATDNATVAFHIAENSASGTIVGLQIPFDLERDPEAINGSPPGDIDPTTLHHEIDPAFTAGGRFTVVSNGFDINGYPRYSLVVANGGSQLLDYEAGVHTPANQSQQVVDNQYQVVINSYDAPGGNLVGVRHFTVILDNVTGEVADLAPTLDLTGDYTVVTNTPGQYRDNFDTNVLTNSNGTTTWTPAWAETGDNAGANSATAGQITIDTLTPTNTLRFGDNDDDAGNGTAAIQRTVDLSGVTTATLSYSFNENSFDAGEIVTVTFSDDGSFSAGHIQTIQVINGNSGNGTTSVALTGSFTATAAIRLEVSGTNNSATTDYVTIDNLNIATVTTTTTLVPGTPGIDYATTYTENGASVAIAQSPVVADADNALIMGATVRLTNAQVGDVLAVGALPAGITASFGPAVAGLITLYLSGPASAAAFQTAIQAVRFGNPADQNPIGGVRTLTVTVNDGQKESTVATASVTVVSVDDPASVGNDSIISTNALGTSFVVPEWALLANDSDPDSALDVTAVTEGSSGFTAVLGGAEVTVTDTDDNNNAFTYTVNGGATGNAAVDTAPTVTTTTYNEGFGFAFNNYTDGDGGWDDNWTETGDDNSSTSDNGQIRVNGNRLEFDNGSTAGNSDGASILRTISDLAGATSATLSYAYTEAIEAGESVLVEFSADGTTWTTVQTITSTTGSGNVNNFALTGPFTANAALRFTVSSMDLGDNDLVSIDNISVAFSSPTTVNGTGGDNIMVGSNNAEAFNGGGGNDIIFASGGDDTITWSVGGGRDFIDGGAGALDRVIINGNNNAETYVVYSNTDDWDGAGAGTGSSAAHAGLTGLRADTEIVITRDGVIVAELDNMEEITINTAGGNDTVLGVGDFLGTSLSFNTITINARAGSNTVDVSGIVSDHRVLLVGSGGDDEVIGGMRPQDVAINHIQARAAVEVHTGTDADDIFHFAGVKGAAGDTITNFEAGDVIDLSKIDASKEFGGNQSFTLVNGPVAQMGDLSVTFEEVDGVDCTVITGNVWGNDTPEFRITIEGQHTLTAANFIL